MEGPDRRMACQRQPPGMTFDVRPIGGEECAGRFAIGDDALVDGPLPKGAWAVRAGWFIHGRCAAT